MATEIERKFLILSDSYKKHAIERVEIVQGYLSTDVDSTVRIRIRGDHGYITVKTRNVDCSRGEWEYEIPVEDVREMLPACGVHVIEKTRWIVPNNDGLFWEIDEFHGRHQGLTIAEIELPSIETMFTRPSFIGEEVTGEPKYYNSVLSGF